MQKILLSGLVLLFSQICFAQTSLSFCTYVDQNGYCVFNNNKFISTPDSVNARLFMEIKSESVIGSSKVFFKIFSVNKNGEEKLENTLEQRIEPNWTMSWMPYLFASPSKFNVKVFNAENQLLCAKSLELIR